MANEEQLSILKKSVDVWNEWRNEHSNVEIDLREADLGQANLSGADLSFANLSKANLLGCDLSEANLREANLSEADLSFAKLVAANLSLANLRESNFRGSELHKANLSGADLYKAILLEANLRETDLRNADLQRADLDGVDLSGALLTIADLTRADLRLENFDDATVTLGLHPNLVKSFPWGNEYRLAKEKSGMVFDETENISDDGDRIIRVKFTLPDLLPLDEYFRSVTERLQAVELIYIIYSTIYSEGAPELIRKILSPKGDYDEPNGYSISRRYATAKSVLANEGIDSVYLVSVHYGSDASFDLLGIGKIVEILRDTLKDVAWRGKHEQQMAKLEQESKEAVIERTKRETEKIAAETANEKLALLERVIALDIDKDQKELILSALIPNLQLLADKPVTPRLKSVSSVKKLNTGTKKHFLPKPQK